MVAEHLSSNERKHLDQVTLEVVDEHLDELLAALIAADTRTPPGDCREIVPACTRWLEEVGLQYRVVAADETLPNVLVEVGSACEDAGLCWNSHVDTVTPGDLGAWETDPFVATNVDGMIRGLGAANCKGGAAMQLCAALALQRSGLSIRRGLVVALVSDEESLGERGLGYLLESGTINPSASLTGEPTGNSLIYAQRGLVWIRVTVHGIAAHGAIPLEGKNAIVEAAKLVTMLESGLVPKLSLRVAPHVPPSSMNIGLVEGGESPNMVAPSCSFTMDRRIVPGEMPEGVVAEVAEACSSAAATRGFSVTTDALRAIPPFSTPADSDLARSLSMAGGFLGLPVRDGESVVISDARFAADGSRQVACFGPGDVAASHGPNERVPRAELVEAVRILALSGAMLVGGSAPML